MIASGRISIKTGAILLAIMSVLQSAAAQTGSAVPDNLRPPGEARLVLRAHAKGEQIYVCQAATSGGSQLSWIFSAPEARLFDDGREIGRHFAGPTWESADGSQVKGKVAAQAVPDPDSIPWLLLTATEHSGKGILSEVTSIQRINTKGGKAPLKGCDPSHEGDKVRAAYSADYYFYASQ